MRIFKKEVAAMIVCSADDQVVMGLKPPDPDCNGPYSNKWVLPGGVVEDGETNLRAAQRETLEETGLDLFGYDAHLIDDSGSDVAELTLKSGERILYQMSFATFRVNIVEPAKSVPLTSDSELVRVEWTPIRSLGNYSLCPPSVVLFRKLGYIPLTTTIN